MSSETLTLAREREALVSEAISSTLGTDVHVSIGGQPTDADVTASLDSSYASVATAAGTDFLILIASDTLDQLTAGDGPDAHSQFLQQVTSDIAQALSGAENLSIQISSPGEINETVLDAREYVELTLTKDGAPHNLIVGIRPQGGTADAGAARLRIPELDPTASPSSAAHDGLGLLADVEVDVTVELGRRRLPINELLTLTRGSIIELDKLVGEPLEVYVNNRLIADGEAVVIDEQFGIRISNIIASAQRGIAGS
ncbi:MAG: flagellar motor switch protein FliN [Bacteroidetes bacterium]|nr:flagellar motor switch protein FliN [Bacteroidota bacterium]